MIPCEDTIGNLSHAQHQSQKRKNTYHPTWTATPLLIPSSKPSTTFTNRITTPPPPMLPKSQATRPSPGAAQHETTTHNYHHNPHLTGQPHAVPSHSPSNFPLAPLRILASRGPNNRRLCQASTGRNEWSSLGLSRPMLSSRPLGTPPRGGEIISETDKPYQESCAGAIAPTAEGGGRSEASAWRRVSWTTHKLHLRVIQLKHWPNRRGRRGAGARGYLEGVYSCLGERGASNRRKPHLIVRPCVRKGHEIKEQHFILP